MDVGGFRSSSYYPYIIKKFSGMLFLSFFGGFRGFVFISETDILFKGFSAPWTANLVLSVESLHPELSLAVGAFDIHMGLKFLYTVFLQYKEITNLAPYKQKSSVFRSAFIYVF